jgi:hypothetical protein
MKNSLLFAFLLLLLAACRPSRLPQDNASLSANPGQDPALPTPYLSPAQTPAFFVPANDADPSLTEVALLAERWRASLLAEPGWLYLARQVERTLGLGPAWDALPEHYLEETWLLLGEPSAVQVAFRQERTEAGQVLQQSLYQDGSWRNLTLGAESTSSAGSLLEFDFGFSSLASRLQQAGSQLNRQTLYNNCWYIGEKYMIGEPPYSYAAVFNPDTGMLRQLATWKVTSGAVSLVSQIDVVAQERIAQPPDEVLALLESAGNRVDSGQVQPLSLAKP